MLLKVGDQLGAVRSTSRAVAERVDLEADASEAEPLPESARHHDHLDVDVWAGVAQRLHTDLMELAVAALLRALVAEHGPHVPKPARAVVEQTVLDGGAHAAGGALGAQGQLLAVERILERIHLLLDDVGDLADGALEQGRRLDQRHADRAVAVASEPLADNRLKGLPALGLVRQNVVHAAHGLQGGATHVSDRRVWCGKVRRVPCPVWACSCGRCSGRPTRGTRRRCCRHAG